MKKDYLIYLIPFISGLIGWITNYIAVKMIFRPRKSINILGLKIQGLIPKRQEELAESIGSIVESHLVSITDIKKIINEPEFHKSIVEKLKEKINFFLTTKLTAINPMIGAFLTGDLLKKVNDILSDEITQILPELIEHFVEHFENNLNFKEMVKDKIKSFDILKLENIILEISAKELKAIEILGGVLGFLIGIVQIIILKI